LDNLNATIEPLRWIPQLLIVTLTSSRLGLYICESWLPEPVRRGTFLSFGNNTGVVLMASLRKENDRGRDGWRLRFLVDKKRRSFRLGNVSKSAAEDFQAHIKELVRAHKLKVLPNLATQQWVRSLDGKYRDDLVAWGLTEPLSPKTTTDAGRLLGPFIDSYIAARVDIGTGSVTNYKQARRLLCEYFGERHALRAITPADADRWRRWLMARPVKWDKDGNPIKTMAPATVSKHVKRTKTMFNDAVRDRLLNESPFADQKGGSESNKDRHHFIDRATAAAVLKSCANHDWGTIFGLTRFAGLRCPSELTRLKWAGVQFDAGRLRIDSTKTRLRFCPIFPELRPILEAAAADRENDLVMKRRLVAGYGVDANLATQFHRILERAGIKPWEKTFINLRSNRRTELQERFPSHVVDAWIGHSTKTAEAHYLQVTDEHWSAGNAIWTGKPMAVELDVAGTQAEMQNSGSAQGSMSGDLAGQNAGTSLKAKRDQDAAQTRKKPAICGLLTSHAFQ
jgi:integrase